MQLLPAKQLAPYIKHYLFLESEEKGSKQLRLFSDGNPGMVFSFRNNLMADGKNLPAAFLYGQINEFKDLYLVNEASLIIVVFQPAGIKLLTGMPQAELRNNTIKTAAIFGQNSWQLYEQLAEQHAVDARVQLLNTFFTEQLLRTAIPHHVLIEASLDFIAKHNGDHSIADLVKYTGYTERQIERTFIEYIGLPPKQFGNVVKLHRFLKLLKAQSQYETLTALCYEAGYADQSHLIKTFRKYTGITPKEYVHKTNKLTNNFMELTTMSGLYNLPAKP